MRVLKGLAVLMVVMVVLLTGVLAFSTQAQAATYCWYAVDGNTSTVSYMRLSLADYGSGHYSVAGTATVYNTTTGASSIAEANGAAEVTTALNTDGQTVSTLETALSVIGGSTTSIVVADVHLLLDASSMSGSYFRTMKTYTTSTTPATDTRYDGVATLTTCLY